MSPVFRNVLRFAGVPVDSSEPVRRKFGSRLIGIVTVCLLPLLVFDVPQWVFILSQIIWGAGVYTGLSVAGDKSRSADTSLWLFKKEQVWWRLFSRASPPSAFRLSTILSPVFVDRCAESSVRCGRWPATRCQCLASGLYGTGGFSAQARRR
jgi:uncharacterized membrane protein